MTIGARRGRGEFHDSSLMAICVNAIRFTRVIRGRSTIPAFLDPLARAGAHSCGSRRGGEQAISTFWDGVCSDAVFETLRFGRKQKYKLATEGTEDTEKDREGIWPQIKIRCTQIAVCHFLSV